MSVMVLQGPKSTPQKSRPLESGHRRYGVRLAIKYSYKLGQKNWCAPQVPMCQSWFYKAPNPPLIESGHRRYGVRLAIKYSYKLGQKNEFKF